jgi:uncharacterized small protein (DUF1192 family)
MMEDDDRPHALASGRPDAQRDAAALLTLESLESYSLDELDARVGLLEAEIARVKAHRDKSSAHRLAAEALFRTSSSPSGTPG